MKLALLLFCFYKYLLYYFNPINKLYFEIMSMKFDDENKQEKTERIKKVVAVDFDNTICYTNYPTIIKPLPYAIEVLKVLMNDHYTILILYTCREGEYLKQALDFCELYGIKFDYVNENVKERIELYGNDCRKIGYDLLIDDKSYEGIQGVEKLWKDWYMWMKENKIV